MNLNDTVEGGGGARNPLVYYVIFRRLQLQKSLYCCINGAWIVYASFPRANSVMVHWHDW